MQEIGKLLFIAGLVLAAVGLLLAAVGLLLWKTGGLAGLGRLPGDISVQRPSFSFHFPITTCIIISIVLTLLMWLFRK